MAAKVFFNMVKTAFLSLALVLFMCKVVSSQALSYYVDSLDDTRKAMLSYSSVSSGASSPSNSYLRTVDEIEKSVYEAQATRVYYTQSSARLKKIEEIIKVAAKQGSSHFIRQSLGHALYTVHEIEKASVGRKKRCSLCADAMRKFMKLIEKKIGNKNFSKFVGNIKLDKATLMFAIDDTGSMHDEIQAAKDIATYIVRDISRPNLDVDYILSPFNDPERGRALKKGVGKGEQFIKEIDALGPHGGGDCPEMTFTGIKSALYKGPASGSPLYVFTDASPKDATKDLVDEVTLTAKGSSINVYFFLSNIPCGTTGADKPFKELAKKTCGQVFELPKSSADIAQMKNVTKGLLGGTVCPGAISFNPLGKRRRRATLSGYKLQVDDTMDKIIVSVSSETRKPDIKLTDPSGAPVTSGKITVGKLTIFEVDHPKPGTWSLIVPSAAGKHTYMFKASSKTNMDFDFIFVIPRLNGSPIPISYPLTGKPAHVILIVRATDKIQPASLNLDIVEEDGNVLSTASVKPVGTSKAHFSATFSTPTVPFKLQLKGKTKKNYDFKRNSQNTVTPSHVVVKVLYARNEFTVPKSGNEFTMFFAYNTGATEVFDFKVKSTSNFKAQYSRSSARIYRDRLAFFTVRFTATPSAVRGAADRVLVTVTGRTSHVTASYLVSLMVA